MSSMLTTHKIFISKYSLSGLSQIFTLQSIQNHISLSFSTYALMFRSLIITPEALHGTHPRAALFCRSRVYLKPPKAMTTDTSTINGLIIWRARKGRFSLRKTFITSAGSQKITIYSKWKRYIELSHFY